MNMIRPSVVLAGMLTALPVFQWDQGIDYRGVRPEYMPSKPAGPVEMGASHVINRREAFRQTAEANVAKAAALREKQTSRDFAQAIVLLGESARLFRAGRAYAREADTYLQVGEIYFTLGKYDRALNSYRRALTLGDDPDLRARTLSHMARTYVTQGHTSEADEYTTQAMALMEKLTNKRTQAEVLEARGEAVYWTGDSPHSVDLLTRAHDLYAEVNDDDGQALALLMLAWAVNQTDRFEALRFARQALRLWSVNKNGYGTAEVQVLLGSLSALAGQYETAQCNCEQALRAFEKAGNQDNAASVLNNLGFINLQMGKPKTSLASYRQARAAFASVGDRLGEAEAINGMGLALKALKRYTQLLPLHQANLSRALEAGSREYIAAAQANLGEVYELRHQYSRAEALYQRSLAGYRDVHNPMGEGSVLIDLAHVYREERKLPEAIATLEQARQLKEKTGQVEVVAQTDYEIAFVHRKQGRIEEAHQAILRTIGIVESQRLKMSAFDSRASYFASVHKYYALYIQLLMLLQAHNQQNQLAVLALEASERSKVRSLLDWLAGHSQDVPCDQLMKKQLDAIDAESGSAAATDGVASSPELAPALTLDQIQAVLGDDAVLLEYALGDEKSYVWAVNGKQVTSYELPPVKRLEELVQGLRGAVAARQIQAGESNDQYIKRISKADGDYGRYTGELSEILLGPLPLSGAKRVIIVPDGPLQYVPFAALSLRGETGRKTTLAAQHEVIMLPSASALAALRRAVALRPAPSSMAAVFADPVFETDDRGGSASRPDQGRALAAGLSAARSEWRDLHGSKHVPRLIWSHYEALAVQKLDKEGQVFVAERFRATRDLVLHHDLGSYRIIHFATHGILDEEHPERSGLILSLVDKKGRPQDGYLRLNDIYGLKLSADLVVLSSCNSGLGKDLSSEGIIGLPRAFLRAGAKSVIATLWKVDDQAAASLMTHFYARLRQGEKAASALRNSQMELSRDLRWHHPYYWAAFVFQGEYR